jgi:hypothetical protein
MNDIGEVPERLNEQVAIARVTSLLTTGVKPADLFTAVSCEVHHLFQLDADPAAVAASCASTPGPSTSPSGSPGKST